MRRKKTALPAIVQFRVYLVIPGVLSFLRILCVLIVSAAASPLAAREACNLSITDWTVSEPGGIQRHIDSTRDDPLFYERGLAAYESSVHISRLYEGEVLAFFAGSIDDADRCYFNGVLIGATGRIPTLLEKTNGRNFRSASRHPRLYVIPRHLIEYNNENSIKLEVFNYSGHGGFGVSNSVRIGVFSELLREYNLRMAVNDAPRLVSLGILFILFLFHLDKLTSLKKTRFSSILHYSMEMLFPFFNKTESGTETNTIIAFKLISNMIVITTMSFFALSEISFKYILIGDELFWFKAPALAYIVGFAAFLTMNYGELFSKTRYGRSGGLVLKALFILAHPIVYIPPIVYILLAPAWLSWGLMVNLVIYWMIVLLFVFMFASMFILVRMFVFDKTVTFRVETKISEISLRLLCIFITMSALICFKFKIRPFDDLVTVMFGLAFSVYATNALNFYVRYRQEIAFGQKDMSMSLLAARYGLSKTESYIALLVKRGHSRKEILELLDISDNTLKGHLRRIYGHVLERESSGKLIDQSNNKLHQLMVVLNKKE